MTFSPFFPVSSRMNIKVSDVWARGAILNTREIVICIGKGQGLPTCALSAYRLQVLRLGTPECMDGRAELCIPLRRFLFSSSLALHDRHHHRNSGRGCENDGRTARGARVLNFSCQHYVQGGPVCHPTHFPTRRNEPQDAPGMDVFMLEDWGPCGFFNVL